MTVSTAALISGIDRTIDDVNQETSAIEKLQRGVSADMMRIDDEVDQAWKQLTETLLPSLDKAAFDTAAQILRLPSIAADTVSKRVAETITQNQNRLKKLTSDDLFVNGEAITNEISIKRAEIDEAIANVRAGYADLEGAPLFEELLAYRYGTPEYQVRFWQLSYYNHWKHADLIVERFGARYKAANFAEIAARYVDEKSAWNELVKTKSVLDARQAAVDQVVRDAATAKDAIDNAGPRALTSARGRVREHLSALDDNDVARLLAPHPAAELAFRRIAGLKKKKEYLKALQDQQLKTSLTDLDAMRRKLYADRQKLNRPKNLHRSWTDDEYRRRFGVDRRPKWQKRRERWEQTRTTVVHFHDYDRWSPTSDLLWWDVMSDGRLDGNFIDEVRSRPSTHHVHHTPVVDTDVDTFRDVS